MALIVGAFTNTPSGGTNTVADFTALRGAVGTTPAAKLLVRRSFHSGIPASISSTESAGNAAAGIVSFLSCKPSRTNVGVDNTAIASLAASMPSGSYLTAWHEPENDMTGAQFVAMFRNFYRVAKAANANIYVGTAHMTYQWRPGGGVTTPDDWWVGASYTDFLFTDTYVAVNRKDGSGNPISLSADPWHQRWHTWAVAKGKPLGLAEHGVDQGFTDAQRAAYYTNSAAWMISQGYRMWLPWNGMGTPPSGQSWDFYGGASSWPSTLSAYSTILGAGQADAVLSPGGGGGGVTSGYVGSTTVQGNPAASLSLTLPTGIQAGDALLLWVSWVTPVSGVATTLTPPSGWTSLGTQTAVVSGSNSLKSQLLKRTAVTSDNGATVTVTVSQTAKVEMIAAAYRGTDASLVSSVTFGADPTTSATTTHGPTPSVALPSAAPVLEFFSGKSATNASYTTPSGTVKRAEVYGAGTAVDGLLLESSSSVTTGGGHSTTSGTAATYTVYATVGLSAVTSPPTYSPPSVSDATVTVPDSTDPLTLQLTPAGSDPAGGTLSYVVDWGDGSPTATGAPYTHSYATAGTYTVTTTATSSVSGLTSVPHTQSVAAVAGGGQEPNRGYWEPAPGTPLKDFGPGLRSAIEAIGFDMNAALGNTTGGGVARSQDALMRAWLLSTTDPYVCTGTVALSAGNMYRYRTLCRSDGNATAFELYVTTVLSGSGIVFSVRDALGNLLASQPADSALGATGARTLSIPTTPVARSTEYVLSIYVPSGASVTIAGSPTSAALTNIGSSLTGLVAASSSASSNTSTLDVTTGSAAALPLLALR